MGCTISGLSAERIRAAKGGRRLAMLTAYDHPTAMALDGAGLDLILVGDSLGQVELGFDSTRPVTLAMMAHHTAAVRRGVTRTHLVADLPADTYRTPEEAVASARALQHAGADSVKLEGALIPQVRAVIAAGIPVMGHVGLLPQTATRMRRQGTTADSAAAILADARALDAAGCYAIVVEAVDRELTGAITRAVDAPTIGIASGAEADGQVLVIADMIGLTPDPPPFVSPRLRVFDDIRAAGAEFAAEVRGGIEPPPAPAMAPDRSLYGSGAPVR
ncbi:MAG: 3-methyl-2-oxobutanoate hydroxymethyltransferase [Thermoleophilia bacterium]|nr:3-methyl-2-oxobutanoate hydroxymethyltransferase [Thermoleophilia bacterium]